TYGVRTFADDSIPTLSVIQTDFLGQNPDTLLSRDQGPETLRGARAARGGLVTSPSMSGLWVFSKAAPDTVFEVSSTGPSRKLVLPEADTMRAGILADLQQEILWLVASRPLGGFDYEAYDISSSGEGGVIDGGQAYLGARTTPLSFIGRVAFDGSVSGWWRGERGVYAPRGFDMRIEELREGAPAARRNRAQRRLAIAAEWASVLKAAEEARERRRQEEEAVREEEQE
ncbi:MAG: hypothetical protein KJO06_06225, partial [Gemmatimonadetes bacterium]|nr:hypothetical protein [Gemmatimonadota bacterium]